MFIVFPLALEINLGTFGLRDSWKLPTSSIRPLSVLSQSLFAWWMSLACIGLFRSCLNKQRPWIRYLSDSSYWLYVAHLPLVVMLQISVLDLPWNSFGKLFAISAVSILLLLLSYQLMVRHTPIGWMLNGRRRALHKPQPTD
jgi:peptidoglycan/LPS O-acetylase OafA/YrhL